MTVTTHYVHIGDGTVVEFVTTYAGDDTTIWVNVLPPASEPDTVGPESARVAAPADMAERAQEPILATPVPAETQCAAAPAPSKKRRTLMGVIRAVWFCVFTGAGAVVDYGIANLTDLPLPPGTATLIGGVLYGAKRAIWPSTTL
jgi:hypothetical protein